MLPSLFLSHGAPNLIFQDVPARDFLRDYAASRPRPRAIVVATAHWDTARPAAGAGLQPRTIYDFGRFDDRLFQMHYAAAGDPALAARILDLLTTAGLPGQADPARGYDHGVWVPLSLMYPDADIPVVPLAVQSHMGPAHHAALGQALAGLGAEDILVIGSGSFTHDLHRFFGQPIGAPEPEDVTSFADWMDDRLTKGATAELLAYRSQAPFAVENHPTEEHLLPLYVAMGASGGTARRVHSSATYGILRMDAYEFQ